jgi:hypothetical protein
VAEKGPLLAVVLVWLAVNACQDQAASELSDEISPSSTIVNIRVIRRTLINPKVNSAGYLLKYSSYFVLFVPF